MEVHGKDMSYVSVDCEEISVDFGMDARKGHRVRRPALVCRKCIDVCWQFGILGLLDSIITL